MTTTNINKTAVATTMAAVNSTTTPAAQAATLSASTADADAPATTMATATTATTAATASATSLAQHCKLSWQQAWKEIFCTRQQWRVTLLIWLVTLTLLCVCSTRVFAATGALPYEEWLSVLQQSLTGPVAFSVSLIGIVTCGATLILAAARSAILCARSSTLSWL